MIKILYFFFLNQIRGIEEWYVMLKEGKTVKYYDFISNVTQKEYYDANHLIVTLSENEVDLLLDKYFIKI